MILDVCSYSPQVVNPNELFKFDIVNQNIGFELVDNKKIQVLNKGYYLITIKSLFVGTGTNPRVYTLRKNEIQDARFNCTLSTITTTGILYCNECDVLDVININNGLMRVTVTTPDPNFSITINNVA